MLDDEEPLCRVDLGCYNPRNLLRVQPPTLPHTREAFDPAQVEACCAVRSSSQSDSEVVLVKRSDNFQSARISSLYRDRGDSAWFSNRFEAYRGYEFAMLHALLRGECFLRVDRGRTGGPTNMVVRNLSLIHI